MVGRRECAEWVRGKEAGNEKGIGQGGKRRVLNSLEVWIGAMHGQQCQLMCWREVGVRDVEGERNT